MMLFEVYLRKTYRQKTHRHNQTITETDKLVKKELNKEF